MENEPDVGGAPEVGVEAVEAAPSPENPPAWLGDLQQNFANQLADFGSQMEDRLQRSPAVVMDDDEFDQLLYGEGEGGGELDPEDERFAGMFPDPDGPVGRQELAETVQTAVNARLAEQLEPLVEAQREEDFHALAEEFPVIQTREGAEAVADQVRYAAGQLGYPGLAGNPSFARIVLLAMNGEQRARPQPSGGGAALEDGGGTPGEPEDESIFQTLWRQQQNNRLAWD
jgi:hypothetical protein